MNLSIISDIHIKNNQDRGYELLISFLVHPKVKESDSIFLLGDIFDFMCGGHSEYFQEFPEFFDLLADLLSQKKEIYYLEGNHDFHLAPLFEKFLDHYHLQQLQSKNFHLCQKGFIKNINGKKIYFGHGDELDYKNYSYQALKAFLRSPPLEYTANNLVPYPLLDFIGRNSSQLSRLRHKKKSYDYSAIRGSFRQGAITLAKEFNVDWIICGHSHIKDDFFYSDFELSFRYLNNGMATEAQTFLHIDGQEVSFLFI